ncbi:protein kinase domain-containing protein [Prauserella cavernicola]|uniref:Protein kinase n=1 Tax=Prauserella cavernicola TaxID=2800127 RepID=A0A934V6U5_9PSEU|nr:protein kinase [Prauserella cavernicola]MBK1786580.1 protein kinase [Prauserella cavernicola]
MFIPRGRILATTRHSTLYVSASSDRPEPVVRKEFHDTAGRPLRTDDRTRLRRELDLQRGLRSPYVLPVLGVDFAVDPPYCLLPMAECSLGDYVRSGAADTLDKAVDIFTEIVKGVAFLHARGLVHGDLKPANALRYHERWTLSDFGPWRDLPPGGRAEEPGAGYSAPERRATPYAASEASDIYSLGTMFFTILTKDDPQLELELDRVPPQFRRIVEKSTSEQPSLRYRDAAELLADVALADGGRAPRGPRAPAAGAEVVRRAQIDLLAGDVSAVADIAVALRRNSADPELFLTALPTLVGPTVRALATGYEDDLDLIVRTYFRYVDALPIAPSYADVVGVFARRVFVCTPDQDLRELCLKTLLDLAHRYNRGTVTDTFIELAQRCMVEGTPITLAATREQVEMVSDRILRGDFPPSVKRLVN